VFISNNILLHKQSLCLPLLSNSHLTLRNCTYVSNIVCLCLCVSGRHCMCIFVYAYVFTYFIMFVSASVYV